MRAGLGAVVGGWVGFVAGKIRFSDWSDESRGVDARRTLSRVTISAAVVGLTVANFGFRSPECEQAKRAALPPAPAATGPITAMEIRESQVRGTAYDVILRLRRGWLARSAKGASEPGTVLYLNDVRMATVDALRTVPAADVASIRFYDGAEATFKWGLGHSQGAIQVRTLSR